MCHSFLFSSLFQHLTGKAGDREVLWLVWVDIPNHGELWDSDCDTTILSISELIYKYSSNVEMAGEVFSL